MSKKKEINEKLSELDVLEEEFKKKIELKRKQLKENIPKTPYKVKGTNKIPQWILGVLLSLIPVISLVIIFILRLPIWMNIVIAIFSFPIMVIGLILLIWRYYKDKHKIKKAVVTQLVDNFVIARFYLPQKRVIERVCLLNKDGISFSLGQSTYLVEEEKIWFNDNNHPVINYLPNIPNPIGFKFEDFLYKYTLAFNQGELDKFLDDEGNMIDLSFTSQNLHTFKKNKLFADLMERITPEMMKIVTLLIFAIIGSFVVMGLMLIFLK